MQWLQRPMLCVIALSLTIALPSGCVSASQDSFCMIYQPVYTDGRDTEETRRQANANNAVWQDICE